MMWTSVVNISGKSVDLPGWSGNVTDLKQLARTIERCASEWYEPKRREIEAEIGPDASEWRIERNHVDLERLKEQFTVQLTWDTGSVSETITGSAEQVIDKVDPRTTRGVGLKCSHGWPNLPAITVHLDATYCRYSVDGPTREWVEGTMAILAKELAHSRQKGRRALSVFSIGATILLTISLLVFLRIVLDFSSTQAFLIACGLGGGLMGGIEWALLSPRLFPRFELVRDGEQPATRRRWVLIGSIGVQIAISTVFFVLGAVTN